MKALSRICTVAALVTTLGAPALAGEALPKPKKDFSADTTMTMDGLQAANGPMQFAGTVQFDAETNRYRREQTVMGQTSIVLQHMDEGKTLILMPAMQSYIDASQAPGGAKAVKPDEAVFDKLEKVGTETIDGIATTKYAAEFESGAGTLWMTDDQIVVKMEGTATQNGQTLHFVNELHNLKVAAQDESAFEIPDGYKPMTMPTMPAMPAPGAGAAAEGGASGATQPTMTREQMQEMQKQMQEQMKKAMEEMQKHQPKAPAAPQP